ncbi:hypothetical protein IKJ53_04275, partial [bacterium]|nr:hypothetical protein [bacterium]
DVISSVFVGNYSRLRGGAIHNEGTISTIRNSLFLQNSAMARGGDFESGNLGGAIYTNSSISFEAVDGYVFEFTGNYVLDVAENPIYQAIYVSDKDAVLTFLAKDGSSFVFNDSITGVSGYNVVIKGENRENDTFKLYNQITGANNINISNIRFDITDGISTNYSFISSTYEDVFLDFDITFNASGQVSSDVISTTSDSSGLITIDNVNFVGEDLDMEYLINNQIKLTILDTSSENLVLEVSDALEAKIAKFVGELNLPPERYSLLEYAIPDISWDTVNLDEYTYAYGTKSAYIGVSDNIKFGFMYKYNVQTETVTDILAIINRANVDNNGQNIKSFFTESQESTEYTVTQNLGITEGYFTLQGFSSDLSSVNLNNYNGFELDKGSVLTLKNVRLTGNNNALITAISHQGVLNLDGAYLDGNLLYTGAVDNAYTINIIGEGTSTITGLLSDVNVLLQSGNFTFGLDTFSSETASLEAVGGVINLADGNINEYNINKLISSSVGVNYSMDVLVNNVDNTIVITADKLNIGKYSLGGSVKLKDINFINEPQSLKTNQSIIDIVELVNTMYGVDVDVSSLDYVSDIATTED